MKTSFHFVNLFFLNKNLILFLYKITINIFSISQYNFGRPRATLMAGFSIISQVQQFVNSQNSQKLKE